MFIVIIHCRDLHLHYSKSAIHHMCASQVRNKYNNRLFEVDSLVPMAVSTTGEPETALSGVNSCDGPLFVNLPDENESQCWNNQVGDSDVNELLCFVSNKMDVMTQDLLVKLCTDFYGKGVIENAKKLVFAKFKSLNLDITLPRFVKRQGHKKKQSDVLDIIGLCQEVGSKLPVFVARDLSNLPSVSANSFDVASLMRDIEEMKLHLLGLADMSRLSREINHAVNSITNVRAVERERAPAVVDQTPIDVDSCLSAKTRRVSDVDSCPSAKTRRAIDVDSCPPAKTRRATDVDPCPSAKTRRAIDVDSSPPSKTRRAIDADSCPSVTTCRAINVDSCPSVTTCRVSDVHSRSSDQDDDGSPFDTTSAVCTGVIDNGCNPVFVCGSLRVSNSTSVGRKNHDVDPKAREPEPSDTVAVAVNSPAAACGGLISPLESGRPARPTKTMAEVVADTREFQPVMRQRSRRVRLAA